MDKQTDAQRNDIKRSIKISFFELVLIAGTRALIGGGVGLLSADRLSSGKRKAIGWAFLLAGIAATIPLAMDVLGSRTKTPLAETKKNEHETELAA